MLRGPHENISSPLQQRRNRLHHHNHTFNHPPEKLITMLFKQYLGFALLSAIGSVTASPVELSSSISSNPAHDVFKREASNIACHDNHGAWGGDCATMISNYNNDGTVQKPDKNGRVGIYHGSCLATVNYYSNKSLYNQYGGPVYSNDALAEMAYDVYSKCFAGNEQIYRSGVGYTDKSNSGDGKAFKFCLSNNNSGGSC
jgi:hypothetical protein